FDNKLLVSLLPPPSEYFEGDSGLPQGTKILGGQKGDITLVSPATRALVLEKNGTCDCCIADNMADHCWYPTGERPCWHCYCKSKGCLWNGIGVRTDSDSDKEDEEDRVCVIKKIKHEHVEEPTGARKKKEIIELNEEVEIVASKAPTAGPSRLTSKPTAPIASSSVPKSAAAAALSTPTPAKSANPAVQEGFVFKDPFMVWKRAER
ncbi:hypothetical protein C0995_016278, partial [Termitomyces sp. Mi166